MLGRVRDVRVCIVLLLLLIPVASKAEQLTVELAAEKYEIINLPDGNQEIRMESFGNLLTPGEPMLPAKTFLIAIPPDAEIKSVSVLPLETVSLSEKFDIVPAPPTYPMNHDEALIREADALFQKNRSAIYRKNDIFPGQPGWFDGEGALGRYRFVRINYVPFAYHPSTKVLSLYPKVKIFIEYSLKTYPEIKLKRTTNFTEKLGSEVLHNFNKAKSWYINTGQPSTSSANYDYVIITTDALTSAVNDFIGWKQSIGFSVNLVTVSWIINNYSGSDTPQKIRNFLIDKYGEWGIEYVLLVGDLSDIPMRVCYPKPNSSNEATPTDYYYADLTGNWNSDGDSRYGEYGQDNVDWVPEVMVGRIPWSSASTVSRILNKLIRFEEDRGSWKNNALLLGAMSNYANEDGRRYAKTDGATLMELHKSLVANIGGSYSTMYEKAGIEPSAYSCSKPLTYANVVDEWAGGEFGMVNWWAHGSKTAAYRKWWAADDGDGVPENSAGEISWETMISSNDCSSLNDNYAGIIFSCSCNNGYPESSNLGRDMIRRGSAGIIASSRLSWYTIGWSHQNHGGNASIDYYFFYYLINRDNRVGDALFNSKLYYSTHFMYNSWGWVCWQNIFDFNLYGDPSLYRRGISAPAPPTVHSISGNVVYHLSQSPIDNADIRLSGSSSSTQTTSGGGYYQFESLTAGADYSLTVTKNDNVSNDFIMGYDAALAARIAMDLYPNPTPEQRLAADVDKNGAVQMYDASLIAQFAVGLRPAPNSYVGDWFFTPQNRDYSSLDQNYDSQNFIAIVRGDVDANWSPAGALPRKIADHYPYLTDQDVAVGELISVPLIAEADEEIYSFDVKFSYDKHLLKYQGLCVEQAGEKFQIFENSSIAGVVKITGFSPQPILSVDPYLMVMFSSIGHEGSVSNITVESYRINAGPEMSVSAQFKINQIASALFPEKFELKQNYPNPFNSETLIKYQLPVEAQVSLTIMNVLGQHVITLVDEFRPVGFYEIGWDGSDSNGNPAGSGIYLYKIQAGDNTELKKMTLLR